MKTLISLIFALLLVAPSHAQSPADHSSKGIRGYAGPVSEISMVNGKTALFSGFQIGWIVNDNVTLGVEARNLQNDIRADRPGPNGSPYVYLWYSGVTAEFGAEVTPGFRLAAHALVGGGEAHWRESFGDGMFGNREKDENHTTSFVVEPGVRAAYALTNWMQLMGGVGYRYVGGGRSAALDQDDLRSFSGSIGFRFGRF